jgi:hypothetical protein
MSRWVGIYNPFSRACYNDPLTIHGTTFNWGSCKNVSIRVIAASVTEFAFEVDPSARCGWAGWIVALTTPSAESIAVDVNAYRKLAKYRAKERDAYCAYSRKID